MNNHDEWLDGAVREDLGMTFRELAQAMAIDDVVMAQHIDALLRDFVEDYRTLFGFWDGVPAESALADAGWRWFRTGHASCCPAFKTNEFCAGK